MLSRAMVIVFAATLSLTVAANAQIVGTSLRYQDFKNFTGTKAERLADFSGRLTLIEFFAYW